MSEGFNRTPAPSRGAPEARCCRGAASGGPARGIGASLRRIAVAVLVVAMVGAIGVAAWLFGPGLFEGAAREAEAKAAARLLEKGVLLILAPDDKSFAPGAPKYPSSVHLQNKDVDDETVELIGDCFHLTSVHFGETNLNDKQMEQLARLPDLTSIVISNTQVTDEGLRRLAGLRRLESLMATHTNITDAGLAHLEGIGSLAILDLSYTRVTDAGMKHLLPLDRLSWLLLQGTALTDDGLRQLKGMKKLGRLTILGTRVTPEGVKELTDALPQLTVEHGPAPKPAAAPDQPPPAEAEPKQP
ncbi:MAG: hypothetical protein JW809_13095 [Pirellulales bacterium]|nr:hypothetical protein [Pirellulales bacterium]